MVPKQEPYCFESKVLSSIRGLICYVDLDRVVIWNPTLREHVVLPDPKLPRPLRAFLGYDPIEDKYKVLCMSGSENAWREEPRVLTLGAQESWRVVEPFSHHAFSNSPRQDYGAICLHGILYYYKKDNRVLRSFDVRSEKIKKIRMPVVFEEICRFRHVLTSYQGRLAWLVHNVELWVLTDPEKQEWSKAKYRLPIPSSYPWVDSPHHDADILGGVTDNEEMICMQKPRERPFYVLYYDLKKVTTRWVLYQGFSGCDSDFYRFPNHIENLMSLKNLF